MPRKRIRVDKLKDIIKCGATSALSDRAIGRAYTVSRTVVTKYRQAYRLSGLTVEQVEAMSDSDLFAALEAQNGEQKSPRYRALQERFPVMVGELKRTGVTLQLLWQEYLQQHPDGYLYSQFCYHFDRWRGAGDLRMHIEHKAGEEMFVDYTGHTMVYLEGAGGEEKTAQIFLAVLGASELTYVEASESQEKEQWCRSNERALRYFGGCPIALIPDNLKSAIDTPSPYEPGINPLFDDFARHFDLIIMPARVRKPRDKALVENAVRLTYQRIFAPLRNQVLHGLRELNESIRPLLEQHNSKNFQRLPYSRRELFERIERAALRPLPAEEFPLHDTAMVTVQANYHVELREDFHYYSVPYYLRTVKPTTKVKMVFNERIVSLYYDNQRVAQHQRDRTPNGYTTEPAHMPAEHRDYLDWSPTRFLSWASSMGEPVAEVIRKVLDSHRYPPQGFKVCFGILGLAKIDGAPRLVKACKRALQFGTVSYRSIQNILKRRLEEDHQPQLDFLEDPLPEHENIRGESYFG